MHGFGYDLGEVNRASGGAVVVFGGQVGSEGKGAIVGYLARRREWGAAICNFMTNAGHSWVDDDGQKVITQQIPMSFVGPDVRRLLVGPGAAITVPVLLKELQEHDAQFSIASRLMIDPRAVIIEEHHRQDGAEHSRHRAGVGKGCGRAQAAKAMRLPGVRLAGDVREFREFLGDTVATVNSVLNSGQGVLVEGSQGFDLDLHHGDDWPFVTSRGCTPAQVCADCGVDGKMVVRSIAVVRSYPIRVGNIVESGEQVGYSGDYGHELTWAEVASRAGLAVDDLTTMERTTVSHRLRRVFEMDWDRVARMSMVCRPTEVALNFADYLDGGIRGHSSPDALRHFPRVKDFVRMLEHAVKRQVWAPSVTLIKTGAPDAAMIDLQWKNGEPGVQRATFVEDDQPSLL